MENKEKKYIPDKEHKEHREHKEHKKPDNNLKKEEIEQKKPEKVHLDYLYSVSFKKALQNYFFGSNDPSLNVGDPIVVETVRGLEIGTIKSPVRPSSEFNLNIELKPILRKATEEDLKNEQKNTENANKASEIFTTCVEDLKLDMYLVSAEYTLDGTKIVFTYIADERVDFRELLKILAAKLHCRIELRQIGARDRAKSIGGLGPCGLPLCCSTFLSDFEGISINMAKNQLLALNIQKLSGQCGKLICCLKYEDSIYSELRVGLPKMGQRVKYKDEEFKITSMNVLSKIIKLENRENVLFVTFDEYFKEAKDATPAKFSK